MRKHTNKKGGKVTKAVNKEAWEKEKRHHGGHHSSDDKGEEREGQEEDLCHREVHVPVTCHLPLGLCLFPFTCQLSPLTSYLTTRYTLPPFDSHFDPMVHNKYMIR